MQFAATPLYDFLNSDWKNIYDTLTSVEKRALWRSVIDEIKVDLKKKTATVSCEAEISDDILENAVKEAGFEPVKTEIKKGLFS